MNGGDLDDWFPLETQQQYVAQLIGRVGLTKCRAECFIRLWAYVSWGDDQVERWL